jgi:hypothetical protein
VTGSKPGYASVSRVSEASTPIAPGTLTTPMPTISGEAVVGELLTVSADWGPAPVALGYQWLRDGEPIEGADAASYTIVPADASARISATVVGSRDGFTLASLTSEPTLAVLDVLGATPSPTIGGTAQTDNTLTAVPGLWAPFGVSLGYRWLRDGVEIDGASGSSYVLLASDVGSEISVRVTGSKAGYVSTDRVSASVTVAPAALTIPVSVSVVGDTKTDQTLSVDAGDWSPDGVSLGYRWLRDGVDIDGATGASYRVLAVDVGKDISVRVTGSKAGYMAQELTSAPVVVVAGTLSVPASVTVVGKPQTDQTLSVDAGDWSPDGVSLGYRWLRDGVDIDGATGASYRVLAVDVGKDISVRVTGSKSGYANVSVTSPEVAVAAARLTGPTSVSIAGISQTDQILTVDPGTWRPLPVTLAYQWLRDNATIGGATASTYKLASSDVGRAISVRVTGSKAGYASESRTATSVQVTAAAMVSATPTISGVFASGQNLTATPGAWTLGTGFSHQWLRNGSSISGATTSTYKLTSSDVGKQISVRVTGTKAGFTPTSVAKTSAKSAKVMVAATPKVTGTLAVGSTLKLTRGTWTSSVSFSYRWLRDGVAIAGATGTSYKATPTDAGKLITARVTGKRSGYATVTLTSATPVRVVKPATPTISGSLAVGSMLTANPGSWSPGMVFSYNWLRSGTPISGATGTTYILTSTDEADQISVKVTGSQPGWATVTKTSAKTVKVMKAGTPTITGVLSVGSTLKVGRGSWTSSVSFTYQWLRNGAAISGATASSYKLTSSSADTQITVKVTGKRSGYATIAKTSAATSKII